jgi:hypothetical protein
MTMHNREDNVAKQSKSSKAARKSSKATSRTVKSKGSSRKKTRSAKKAKKTTTRRAKNGAVLGIRGKARKGRITIKAVRPPAGPKAWYIIAEHGERILVSVEKATRYQITSHPTSKISIVAYDEDPTTAVTIRPGLTEWLTVRRSLRIAPGASHHSGKATGHYHEESKAFRMAV